MNNVNKKEWRQLFDYNSQKEISNEQAWVNKYKKINEDMERKG